MKMIKSLSTPKIDIFRNLDLKIEMCNILMNILHRIQLITLYTQHTLTTHVT